MVADLLTINKMDKEDIKMENIRRSKKYPSIKILSLFIIMMILLLPVTGMSVQIKSMKVIKTGKIEVVENKMMSELMRREKWIKADPYETRRAVMLRVTFSCDKEPKKLYYLDIETIQEKNKWDEWVTQTGGIERQVRKRCGEESDEERKGRLLRESPPEGYFARAYKNDEKGDYEKAISDYSRDIELEPNANAYHNRGRCYQDLEKYNEALRDRNKAIELNPQGAHHYTGRAATYFYMNEYSKAIKDYDKAIQLNPKDPSYYYDRGDCYRMLEKYNEAINDFNKAIELNPKNPDYYTLRGDSHTKLGKYHEAINDFNKAMELNPQDAGTYYNKSCIYSLMGNEPNACKYLKRSIELGWKDWEHIKNNTYFNNIRNSNCYREIMSRK